MVTEEHLTEYFTYQIDYKIRLLSSKAYNLGQDLLLLSARLKDDGYKVTLNSLGEVQQRGWEIDLLCAEIELLKGIRGKEEEK